MGIGSVVPGITLSILILKDEPMSRIGIRNLWLGMTGFGIPPGHVFCA